MFFTDFGKSGYWNDALFEAIFTSKAGIVVSVKFPFTFPSTENCPVVYYSAAGSVFAVEDVRELITAKVSGDVRPVCYCFGFTEGFIRQEIEQTGKSTVPTQVTQFIKEKLCVCEVRNPAGACCLGEINRTVKILSAR